MLAPLNEYYYQMKNMNLLYVRCGSHDGEE